MLAGEPAPGAPEAGIDFVGDEEQAALVAKRAQRAQEAPGRDALAPSALDGFDENRAREFPVGFGSGEVLLDVLDLAEAREARGSG